ncbi:MAG: cobyric acid synthase [Polyangiaceae bacterium]
MARALAVLGSASGVGKSLVATALCRLLSDAGIDVAPFKAQNMGNQAGVTPDGLEMARAQILQAAACWIPPHVDMGPVLMKPVTSTSAQIVVLGKAIGQREASDYFKDTAALSILALAALDRLAARHRAIVIEGAGSPVELNLMDRDYVNLRPARHLDAAIVLVTDIDRGGVFAQAKGTMDLMPPEDRARVMGIVVNRFKGDAALFADGIGMLETLCDVPVLAVIPHVDHALDEEDGPIRIPIDRRGAEGTLKIGAVLSPRVSNTEDLAPLLAERDAHVSWITDPTLIAEQDLVVLPGSKATLADLAHHTASGMAEAIRDAAARGTWVAGICGGFQMLGEMLHDEAGTEGGPASWTGLGLLPIRTVFRAEKSTVQSAFVSSWPVAGQRLDGYEIHHGRSESTGGGEPLFLDAGGEAGWRAGRAFGSYLHGLFGNDAWRGAMLNRVRRDRGLPEQPAQRADPVSLRIDRWAEHVRRSMTRRAWERIAARARG